VTFPLREHGIHVVLLDIEGTTTPMAFVYDVLFPFARAHLRTYLQQNAGSTAVREAAALLRDEWKHDAALDEKPPDWPDPTPASAAPYVEWLTDRDRKSPGLKLLQGLIWQRGYAEGVLRGDVFADVAPAFRRWRERGVAIAIYSSGSVLAQRLLFGTTSSGDLTTDIAAFFDTDVGPKRSRDSYRRIAELLRVPAAEILFVSDVREELEAAQSAGCRVLLAVRPGNRVERVGPFDAALTVHSFDEIV
jgi:enolase-phosphatase E1